MSGLINPEDEAVEYQSEERRIVGILNRPALHEGPAPGVVLFHGFTSQKNEDPLIGSRHGMFSYAAAKLNEAGYATLRSDFGGHGESDGEFEDLSMRALVEDAMSAVGFLRERPEVDAKRVGVVGMSMGGMVSCCLSARDPELGSVVLWNAPPYPLQALAKSLGAERVDASLRGETITFDWEAMAQFTLKSAFLREQIEFNPLVSLTRYRGPLLVVVSRRDQYINPQPLMGTSFQNAHAGRNKLVVAGGNHGFDCRTRGAKYLDEVVSSTIDWLNETL